MSISQFQFHNNFNFTSYVKFEHTLPLTLQATRHLPLSELSAPQEYESAEDEAKRSSKQSLSLQSPGSGKFLDFVVMCFLSLWSFLLPERNVF